MPTEIEFFSVPPRAELAPFVESVWGVRAFGPSATEAVVPNGAIELMVNFGPTQAVVGHGERSLRATYERAWLAGIQDRRLVHASEHGADHIAVRFRPGGAHAFFDLPMDEAANAVVELEALIGAAATGLRDRLGELPSDAERIEAFQDWLVARRRVGDAFAAVSRAIEMLRHPAARAPVADACERLGISNKHLIDHFRRIVGLPPKVLGRILRFQRVVAACRPGDRVDWLDLVHDCGYADQSHLIREFRRFAGLTPTAFLDRLPGGPSHPAALDG